MPAHIEKLAFCGMRRLHMLQRPAGPEGNFCGPFDYLSDKRHWFEFARINVVIGPNGGGKSTLIDMIGTLMDPSLLCTLPREFPLADADTAFVLQTSQQMRLECRVWPMVQPQADAVPNLQDVEQQKVFLHIYEHKEARDPALHKAGYSLPKFGLCSATHDQVAAGLALLDCVVRRWNPDTSLVAQAYAAVLNEEADYLDGVCGKDSWSGPMHHMRRADIISARDDTSLRVWLDDDLLQPNVVQITALPAGWRRFAALIHWMLNVVPEGAICLLEEPETHLHPRLQRRLARRMNDIATKRKLQLFVSTHAPVFMHQQVWNPAGEDVALLEATGGELRVLSDTAKLLDALGIRGSDIYQSNGIVWVEGPSDRVYIRHWMHLWCQEHGVTAPQEHVDYSFQFYGGAILAHYSAAECDGFISLLRLNRNMMLVMDRDNDFAWTADGSMTVLNSDCAKTRVWKELAKDDPERVWITAAYTIESELCAPFVAKYCAIDGDRPMPRSGSKVALALRYVDEIVDFGAGLRDPAAMEQRIAALLRHIAAWGH